MNYNSIRSFKILKGLINIPIKQEDGRNVCITLLSENQDFLSTFNYLPFRLATLRYVFVPTINKPMRTYLTPEYKKAIMEHKLRPVKGILGEFEMVKERNFYLDFSLYMNMIKTRFKAIKFLTGRPLLLLNQMINAMRLVPKDKYENVLIYSVNLDEYIDPRIRFRKIWPIVLMLQAYQKGIVKDLPFERLMLHVFDKTSKNLLIQLYSSKTDKQINLGRIRALLMQLNTEDEKNADEQTSEETAETVADHLITHTQETIFNNHDNHPPEVHQAATEIEEKKIKIKDSVESYMTNNNIKVDSFNIKPEQMKKLAVKSIVYHAMALDNEDAEDMEEELELMPAQKQAVKLNEYSKNVLPKLKMKNTSEDSFIKLAKPEELTDQQNPGHIYEKRRSDFRETLVSDLLDTFKVLENKHSSLKIQHIDVKTVRTPPSELEPTVRDRYSLKLTDKNGHIHPVTVELPHLTENGTFLVNGQEKVIINQMITYPIFFFKPYHGKFTSSYSAITVHSKILSRSSYLMCYMAGYKLPLILWLAYKEGFVNTLHKYGVEYSLSLVKESDDDIILPNKVVINIHKSTEYGRQLLEGLKYSTTFLDKKNTNLDDPIFWRSALEQYIGNRNCIYLMDQIWTNIVTPIEIKLLMSKGDPTNISDILLYISTQVVNGRVDDRNSLNKQRVRTSEIFVALVQKQIHAAYNEYEAKLQSGDTEAKLYIDPTKTFSDVINSQNVQTLENINPIEEISTMTRITPVGIGGVTDKMAFPPRAMGIHETYYGNVDPLETPDGAGVGITQQLSIGSSITNIRGMFNIKDHNHIKPSELLSAGPSMIPFVESNEGCRVLMAAGQMKQAIPLKYTEEPAIQTGYESILTNFLSDNFIKKSPVNGVVENVEELLITIKDNETGKLYYIDTKPRLLRSGQGLNGLSVFKNLVKVGQHVKTGQVLSEGSNINNGCISNGLNVLVMYAPWKGYNFEDGMVVSESLAKRFLSVHLQEEKVYLKEDEDVIFIGEVGSDYSKGSIILTYTSATYDVESFKHLRSGGGKIVNIEVYSNIEEDKIPVKLLPAYEHTKKMTEALEGKYSLGTFREKGDKIEGIMIKFTIEHTAGLYKGDKLNQRHFNKGVISIIEPDENMPFVPELNRHVDMIYNPLSVINRMNTGQLCELHTSLISYKLALLMETNSREKFTEIYQNTLLLLDGTEGKEYSKNVLSGIRKMSDKDYELLRTQTKTKQFVPLIFPPFKSPSRDNILKCLKMLGLKPRYRVRIKEYDNMLTGDPVAVGFIYVMKLEHMVEKKIQARSIGPYVAKTMAATQGRKRQGGQTVSEGDIYSLIAWQSYTIIDELHGAHAGDHISKNLEISDIIQNGSAKYRPAQSNPMKDLFSNMMLAVHLRAD